MHIEVGATEVESAAAAIAPHIIHTPVVELAGDGFGVDATLVFKLEYLQRSGSFKGRGATNFVATQPIADAGIVAASGGNHGAAVAWAARRFGHPCTIFVPTISAPAKVERLRRFGADVRQVGAVYAEALEASRGFEADTGATSVHAYEDPAVLAGAGTCALELWSQSGGVDAVLFAVGGGGLAGGGAAWLGDRVPIVCCETEGTRAFAAARATGEPVDVEISGLAADALGATRVGSRAWALLDAVGADSAVVTDAELDAARQALWEQLRVAVEPSAAASLAALTSGAWVPPAGARVGVVLCGANTTIG